MADAPLYFERRCRVIVGRPQADYRVLAPDAVEVEGLRVQFKVTKTGTKEPNTAEVSVWNLSAETRAAVQLKGARIIVLAGYRDIFGQLFSGDVRTCDHVRDGAHWVSKLQAGDGERASRYARVSESFAPGVAALDVARRLSVLLGLDPGNLTGQVAEAAVTFTQGYSARGRVSDELGRLLDGLGLTWSIQDGRLQVLAPGESAPGSTSVEISQSSGLVSSPEHGSPDASGKPGVLKVKSLLQPDIRPRCRFSLVSDTATGGYRAGRVDHAGDTAGGEWYTTAEATPL